MKKRISLLIVLIIMSVCLPVFSSPFGLDMGMSLSQVQKACGDREPVKVADGIYRIIPIKPHPYFISYIAWIDDLEGLNYVKAIGKEIQTSGYGIELQTKFDSLEASISKTYGICSRTDTLLSDSIWDEPRDWMTAIKKNERFLFSQWDKEAGSTLPVDIATIFLGVDVSDDSHGNVILEYEFVNHQQVETKKNNESDSVF